MIQSVIYTLTYLVNMPSNSVVVCVLIGWLNAPYDVKPPVECEFSIKISPMKISAYHSAILSLDFLVYIL